MNELAQIAELKTPTLYTVRAERRRRNADIAISDIAQVSGMTQTKLSEVCEVRLSLVIA